MFLIYAGKLGSIPLNPPWFVTVNTIAARILDKENVFRTQPNNWVLNMPL